jgi:hypothetical protein
MGTSETRRFTDPPEEDGMAREVQIGPAATGKLRGFWAGFGLTIVTLGFYYYWWFYYVNRELKDIGVLTGDAELAQSRPGRSVLAVTLGAFLIVPPFVSIYGYVHRVKRAQRLLGVPAGEQISTALAFLLYLPGGILLIPYIVHFWYVTGNQNRALQATVDASDPVPVAA